MTALNHRYDFVYLFDVTNGNPNGDPDAGNLPRLDPETNQGLVTDVCLKRKVRNFVELAKSDESGYAIYVQEGALLNEQHRKAYRAVRPDDKTVERATRLSPKENKQKKITADEEMDALRGFMCDNFFDVRTFGAVMSTGINCGQVRGPVQMTFARSIDPIVPLEMSITRMAATTEKEKQEREQASDEPQGDERIEHRTMGRKHIVPYGLYRAHGFISAKLAERTGFSPDDLDLLWIALTQMFEHDRSAARGEMVAQRLIAFRHESALGNAPAHKLFERVCVERAESNNNGGMSPPARHFSDYSVSLNLDDMPANVEVIDLL